MNSKKRDLAGLCRHWIRNLKEFFRWDNRQEKTGPQSELPDLLEDARREWRYAKLYFNCVTDPDLIDHAVLYMGAAEKKYIYLLKQARETGLNIEPVILT